MSNFPQRVSLDVQTAAKVRAWDHKGYNDSYQTWWWCQWWWQWSYIVVCSACRYNGLNFVTSALLGWIMLPRWLADGILHISKVPISKQSPSRSDWRPSPEPCVLLWDHEVSCSDNYIQEGYKL